MSGLPGDTAGTEARLAGESGEPAAAAPHENEQVHQALVSPAAEGASASGPLQRVWQGLATAGIWTGRALIAAVAVLTLIDIGQEWKQNEVIIDPVLVPEAVAKAGWTSEVLAGQIKDDIGRIDEAGRTDYPHALYGLRSKSEDPDFTVAGGTISARAFARWIHKVVAGPPRRLVGEVIALGPVYRQDSQIGRKLIQG